MDGINILVIQGRNKVFKFHFSYFNGKSKISHFNLHIIIKLNRRDMNQ